MDFSLKYRIKSRPRFIAFVAITMIAMVVMVNTIIGTYNAASYSVQDYIFVEVESGDSIWSIAQEHMPAGMDTRRAVHKICAINDIGSVVYEGQVLKIPVYE